VFIIITKVSTKTVNLNAYSIDKFWFEEIKKHFHLSAKHQLECCCTFLESMYAHKAASFILFFFLVLASNTYDSVWCWLLLWGKAKWYV